MFNWLKRNKKDREWIKFRDQLREACEVYQHARQFTFMKCHWCHTPATSSDANFCSNCGASLHTEHARAHQDTEHTTDPLQMAVGERPMDAYRRQLQQTRISEQDTQEVPAARPVVGIKRTVRIPRIERLA